jgi:Na+/melibiose symporter-like transporter
MSEDKGKRVPVGQKIAWGMGGFAENLANNALLSVVYPIFEVALKLNPVYIGIALSASRFLDAFVDPVVGNLTDNTKSRWGRRRPWIFVGAILMAFFFALTWFVPTGLGQTGLFMWLMVCALLFFLGFTVFVIPYSGLGLEMAVDYNERTRLQVFRLVPAFIGGALVYWLYKLALLDVFKGDGSVPREVVGMRWVGIGAGILILICAMAPALFTRERFASQTREHVPFLRALKLTFTDKSFAMLMGSVFAVFLGLFFVSPLMTYIGIYHVCGGADPARAEQAKNLFAEINGLTGTIGMVAQLAAMPVIAFAAKYVDKKTVLFTGLGIAIFGYASSWWLFTPENPWLMIAPPLITNLGLCSCWVVNGSFVADICDQDELKNGTRREGMYSAVFAFVYKSAIGLVALASSALLAWAGADSSGGLVSPDALGRIRSSYAILPSICLGLAIVSMVAYPLTRGRVREIQDALRARRGDAPLET